MKKDLLIKKIKFLFGMVYLKFDFNNYPGEVLELRLCGIKVITMKFWAGYSDIYLFKFLKFRLPREFSFKILKPFLVKYVEHKAKITDAQIIALFNRSGETFLLLHHLKKYLQKSNINNPVFVSTFSYLESICKMFYPDIKFVKIPQVFFELHFCDENSENYLQFLPNSHFMKLEQRLQKGNIVNFYSEIKNRMSEQEISCFPTCSKDVIESVNTKKAMLGITKPYIFIAPSAQSNDSLSRQFWDKLVIALYNKGYDLFFNTIPEGLYSSSYKHCYLSISEAKYFAESASAIIGVRSGLLDIISNSNSKIFALYKPFKDRGKDLPYLAANFVMNGFSLKYLPQTRTNNCVYEYNAEENPEEQLLTEIVNNIPNVQVLSNNENIRKI